MQSKLEAHPKIQFIYHGIYNEADVQGLFIANYHRLKKNKVIKCSRRRFKSAIRFLARHHYIRVYDRYNHAYIINSINNFYRKSKDKLDPQEIARSKKHLKTRLSYLKNNNKYERKQIKHWVFLVKRSNSDNKKALDIINQQQAILKKIQKGVPLQEASQSIQQLSQKKQQAQKARQTHQIQQKRSVQSTPQSTATQTNTNGSNHLFTSNGKVNHSQLAKLTAKQRVNSQVSPKSMESEPGVEPNPNMAVNPNITNNDSIDTGINSSLDDEAKTRVNFGSPKSSTSTTNINHKKSQNTLFQSSYATEKTNTENTDLNNINVSSNTNNQKNEHAKSEATTNSASAMSIQDLNKLLKQTNADAQALNTPTNTQNNQNNSMFSDTSDTTHTTQNSNSDDSNNDNNKYFIL